MRAILYARFSTDRQSETSIDDQFRVCRRYAAQHGWPVDAELEDQGISGAALGNRPGAKAALEQLRAGVVLIVNDLTRLARSQELGPIMARVKFRGGRVIGVQDSFDSESRSARMQAGLSGIMSEELRAGISERTWSSHEMRAEAGQSTGGKTYGFAPGEAEIVQEIFRRYADGESMRSIACDLNVRGVPSPGASWKRKTRRKDGKWLMSALHAILHNERYIGRVVWNRTTWDRDPDTGRRTRRLNPESEWIVRECEPIVDRDHWERAQARYVPTGGRGGVPSYLLSGLLVCDLCGNKMIVAGGSQRRYVCSSYHHGGAAACSNSLSAPRKLAEERILEPIMQDLLSPARTAEAFKEWRAGIRKPNPAAREIEELQRLVREGVLSAEIAAPALAEARKRATPPVDLPTLKAWQETVREMRQVLMGEDAPIARDLLKTLLGEIRLRPGDDSRHLVAELTARRVMLPTGTGIWVGSGGAQLLHIPTSSRSDRWLQST